MNDSEQALLEIFRKLNEQDAQTLLRFATFLANEPADVVIGVQVETTTVTEIEIPRPEYIERPENERVVDALKRLAATYPMLDKKKLLDKASELVAQHVMFGKPARVVIDEIEVLFSEAYDRFVQDVRKG